MGSPIGFILRKGSSVPQTYYYVKNLQGDVLGIIDSGGNVKAAYRYNAWGEILSATGELAEINPIRYRGYYYDSETGLYYLQSRYYDPVVGRFLNADAVPMLGANGDFIGYNLFAYCGNNPVNYSDSYGYNLEDNYRDTLGSGIGGGIASPIWIIEPLLVLLGIVDYENRNASHGGNKARSSLDFGSSTGTPPGPEWPGKNNNRNNNTDPNYRGGTTYNRNGIRIDYESYGNGNGNVHIQLNNEKYYYDYINNTFRCSPENGSNLAPKSIQKLLDNPEICRAIAKGLYYLFN